MRASHVKYCAVVHTSSGTPPHVHRRAAYKLCKTCAQMDGEGILGCRQSLSIRVLGRQCLAEAEKPTARSQSTFCTAIATVGPFKAIREHTRFLLLTLLISGSPTSSGWPLVLRLTNRVCSSENTIDAVEEISCYRYDDNYKLIFYLYAYCILIAYRSCISLY